VNTPNPLLPIIARDGDNIIVQGPITIDNVVSVTQRGAALFDQPHCVIDLGKVTEVDSTIISMLLEWLRAARQGGHQLEFVNMPASLASLIQLYDVAELIPVTPRHTEHQTAI
jgi:phospholipid transport system transporter-binding protein